MIYFGQKKMTKKQAIQLFQERKVRTVWDDQEEKWYFSIVDVCGVLTDSKDALTARKYWNKLKQRLKDEGNETVTNCYQLKLRAADGNGRMSRLLMNHLQFEYQLIPMKVMKEQKAEYIQSLVDAREQDDISIFRRVMFDLHIRNLQQEIGQFRESMEQDVIGDKQKNVTDVTDRQHAIINLIKEHTNMTTTQMAERLGVTKRTILRDIEALKAKGLIIRVGSEKTGYWELKQLLL
jgi:biotin operon repressor